MAVPDNEWLLVIDMQRAFADPPSPWASAGFYDVLPRVERLVDAYRGRVVLTRYVAPIPATGAWAGYFEAWPGLLLPAQDPAWDLKLPAGEGVLIETRTTFSKWDAAMASVVGPASPIAICGVATECCVLATALGAVDDGRQVRLIADACAGGTPEAHVQALGVLSCLTPLVVLTQTDDVVAAPTTETAPGRSARHAACRSCVA